MKKLNRTDMDVITQEVQKRVNVLRLKDVKENWLVNNLVVLNHKYRKLGCSLKCLHKGYENLQNNRNLKFES